MTVEATVVLRLKAETDEALREMRQAAGALGELGETAETVGIRAGETAETTNKLGSETQLAAGSVANLSAQFNDIGVMLAAGQNPLQLALQQGTQITQVIGPMGAAGAVNALKTAFLGLFNPVSVLTIGIIALGGAAVQWFTRASSAAGDFQDALEAADAGLQGYRQSAEAARLSTAALFERFGTADPVLRAVLADMAALGKLEAYRGIDAAADSVRDLVLQLAWWDERSSQSAAQDFLGLFSIRSSARAAGAEFANNLELLSRSEEPAEKLRAALDLRDQLLETAGGLDRLNTEQEQFYTALAAVIRDLILLGAEADEGGRQTRAAQELRGELEAELALRQAILRYGKDSAEAENLRIEQARKAFEARLAEKGIVGELREDLQALWNEANPRRDPDAEIARAAVAALGQTRDAARARRKEAEETIATLEREVAIQEAIRDHGEHSVEVARLRAAAEREVYDELLASSELTEDQKRRLTDALAAGEQLALLDLAGAIGAGADEAARLAEWLGISLESALRLARMGPQGVPAERDPSGRVYSGRGGDPRAQGGSFLDWNTRDATRFLETWRPSFAAGGGGGGRGRRNGFADLQREAEEALLALDDAVRAINEKVAAGLLSTSEGAEAVAAAKGRAANALAELIPQLDRMAQAAGPDAAGAVDQWRTALRELSGELSSTGRDIKENLQDGFADALADATRGAESAAEAVADLGQTVLDMIARILAERFTASFVSPLIDAFVSILPFAQGGVPGAGAGDLSEYADTTDDKPIAFAMGKGRIGIAREAGEEAILPVRSDGARRGVLATTPDGRQGIAPLRRMASGALGIDVAGALAGLDQVLAAGARTPARSGGDAILPVRSRAGLPHVLAAGGDGRATEVPLRRVSGGALAIDLALPPRAKTARHPLLDRPTFFARGGVVGAGGLGAAPPAPAPGLPGDRPRVTVNVHQNASGAEARVEERMEGDVRVIDVLIERVEAGIAANTRRGVGPLADLMGGTYGLSRRPR